MSKEERNRRRREAYRKKTDAMTDKEREEKNKKDK